MPEKLQNIKVYIGNPAALFAELDFAACLKLLSETRRQEIMKAKFYKDRCLRLAGDLLIRLALQEDGDVSDYHYIIRTEAGRPYIASSSLDFNVTHTDGLVAVAIGQCKLGIDAEKIEPAADLMDLAGKYFTASEYSWLSKLDSQKQVECFYAIWTAKESVIKAVGSGFSIAPDTFSVVTDREDRLASTVSLAGQTWRLLPLPDTAGCKIALCADTPFEFTIREVNPDAFAKNIKKLR